MALQELKSLESFNEFISKTKLAAVVFSASWVPQCAQLHEIIAELVKDHNNSFEGAFIDAEGVPEASMNYSVSAAPTVVFFNNGKNVDRLDGFNPSALRNCITKLVTESLGVADYEAPLKGEDINDRLKRLINKSRLVLFMKGDKQQPRCGFSRQIVELLDSVNADYTTFDILQDDEVRQGLKIYSDWPTYPQLYLDGELIGGLDIVREELIDPSFVDKIPKV
uniref:Glutaredoxin domain-containing protein n=1 Tax=Parastrongyloides trichosuri TaxID=131310 RepID=A0A0N4Z1B6_PARTI